MLARCESDPGASADCRTTVLLCIEELGYESGGVRVLDGVTLDIRAGRPTVLLGPNGSGKSTLLRLLMRLIEPTAGRIVADPGLRMALVFQKPVMLRRTVAANLGFALRQAGEAADPDRLHALLDRVGLAGLAERPARRLSGGEQQRLALARALARSPDLLLLDEPTASLDPAQTRLVEGIITAVAAQGVKVVMSTHDLGQARRLAGEIAFLAAGRLVERASPDTFFRKPVSDAARRFVAGEIVD